MPELFTIEKVESELSALYAALEHNSDVEKKKIIQQEIQKRNLFLSRLMPNE